MTRLEHERFQSRAEVGERADMAIDSLRSNLHRIPEFKAAFAQQSLGADSDVQNFNITFNSGGYEFQVEYAEDSVSEKPPVKDEPKIFGSGRSLRVTKYQMLTADKKLWVGTANLRTGFNSDWSGRPERYVAGSAYLRYEDKGPYGDLDAIQKLPNVFKDLYPKAA